MTYQPKVGDVVSYRAKEYHCRESVAVAIERYGKPAMLVDTYWGVGDYDAHVPDVDEAATAELMFNLSDYDEIDRWSRDSATWATYAPADRERITSQHGLQTRWFIRKGAQPDWPTQIENARAALAEKERQAASAARSVEYAREDLERVLAAAEAAGIDKAVTS